MSNVQSASSPRNYTNRGRLDHGDMSKRTLDENDGLDSERRSLKNAREAIAVQVCRICNPSLLNNFLLQCNAQSYADDDAGQACDACRQKKARCDEDVPTCGLCRRSYTECLYSEPRVTKKDQSIQIAINSIRRLEAKVDELMNTVAGLKIEKSAAVVVPSFINHGSSPADTVDARRIATLPETASPHVPKGKTISFSQHGVLLWPGVISILPRRIIDELSKLPRNYAVELERSRSPLSSDQALIPEKITHKWLNNLPIGIIRALTDAFFATFNGLFPVLDRRHFFSLTLGKALDLEFDHSNESTTLLLVLALGCLAVEGHREGDYSLRRSPDGQEGFAPPDWYTTVMGEEHPGLSFFNEARKRMGFHTGSNNLYNCQVYLLTAFYYTQILRPMDSYLMLVRAASCSLTTLTCSDPTDFDSWEGDMESRVFWCTLMYETIITQELELPKSGLHKFEATVPLPTFRSYRSSYVDERLQLDASDDDSFFHYHFLAQAANRIMLTRIGNSLYTYDESGDLPPRRIALELHHQIEQWRDSLPAALKFGDETMSLRPSSPGHAIAEALLRSRYQVLHFHLGRPYLYKALHNVAKLTDDDIEWCRSTWKAALNWPIILGICKKMKSCMLLKFGWSCQLFGQLVLMYCFAMSEDARLRDTLPEGWDGWWCEIVELLQYSALHSPTIAKDVELVRYLQDLLFEKHHSLAGGSG